MRRRLSLVIAFIGVVGLMGLAPAAYGGHADPDKFPIDHPDIRHEHSPAPNTPPTDDDLTGGCAVIGTVEIGDSYGNGGIQLDDPAIKNHNHYRFVDTQIICESTNPDFSGNFLVDAAGGTDGQGGQEVDGACTGMKEAKDDDICHGENISVGWSHGSCYDDELPKGPGGCGPFSSAKGPLDPPVDDLYDGTNENPDGSGQCTNCGEIEVRRADGAVTSTSTDNWVKFCRGVYDDGLHSPATCSNVLNGGAHSSTGGSNVLAWGALNPDQVGGSIVCFLADLEFIPKAGSPNAQGKINGATLVGDALIWEVPSKDDCEGKKNVKP